MPQLWQGGSALGHQLRASSRGDLRREISCGARSAAVEGADADRFTPQPSAAIADDGLAAIADGGPRFRAAPSLRDP